MQQSVLFQFAMRMLQGGVLLLLCLFLLLPSPLPACAMSALIATDGHFLEDLRAQGAPESYYYFNDPWDYFGFVMANSRVSSNSDGYGVVSYSALSPLLSESRMWYKRVLDVEDFNHTYYTGNYLAHLPTAGNPPYDVLDRALDSVKAGNSEVITMLHARNASGMTLGNHPFYLHLNGHSYSFMHNGNATAARDFMIHEITRMYPQDDWFHSHPSNYFNCSDPYLWVDSEVLFHYIMLHVVATHYDLSRGIVKAMQGIRPYLDSSSYNFIMSDGIRLYAFRSTSSSSYQLSYKLGHGWIGIRTQSPYADEIRLRPLELVVFSRTADPLYINIDDDIFANPDTPASSRGITLSPNPVRCGNSITLTPEYPLTSGKETAIAEVYNTKGQILISSRLPGLVGGSPATLPLGSLSSGVYFCRIRSGGYATTIRFSVVK